MNARPQVADVILIMTDGEPTGPYNVKKIAYDTAKALKNKDVLIVGVAIGRYSARFKHVIENIATNPEYTFDVQFHHIDNILNRLVDKSCKPFVPGKIHSLQSGSKLGNKVFLWPILFCPILSIPLSISFPGLFSFSTLLAISK